MVYRVLGGLAFSLVGWLFMIWSGTFGGSAFNTNFFGDGELVERPVAEVYAALDAIDMNRHRTLEIMDKVPPVGKVAVPGQSVSWTVFAGKYLAMTLEAKIEPARDGAAAVVRTDVTRHDVPRDQVVAPSYNLPGGFELALRMAMAEALAPTDDEFAAELRKARASVQLQAMSPGAMIGRAEAHPRPADG